MNKPIKPNITIPESFAKNGIKTDFDSDLITEGFDSLKPDVLAGDNLNKFIDDTYKGLNYGMAAADAINLINEGETLTVVDGKLTSGATGGGLELCDIGMALYVDETKGLRRYLNGQIVDINTNTQAFLNRLQQIQTTNPEYFTTEDNWQAEALLNIDGCVYKFVLNYSGADVVSVRLPKYPDYVEINAGGTLPVVGNGTALGYTNGKSNFNISFNKSNGNSDLFNGSNYGATVGAVNALNVNIAGDNNSAVGLTTDPTKSGIQTTLKQTKLKMRYFIQIATGSETENNIINEIELNNPYSLFDSKYSDHELNNLSWLKSEGQWNAKAVYTNAYDKLLKVYNGTETVEGLSVKLSTETYTDYDFVLNTAEETFRLPLKTKLASGNAVVGNGNSLGLIANTPNNQFGLAYGFYNGIAYLTTYNNLAPNEPNIAGTTPQLMAYPNSTPQTVGVTTDPTKSGIETSDSNLYLYFYVGETVQNANLIDAGRIGEQLANKVDINSKVIDGQWVNSYKHLGSPLAVGTYTFDLSDYLPQDGYIYEILTTVNCINNTNGTNTYICLNSDIINPNEGGRGVLCLGSDSNLGGVSMYNSGIVPVRSYFRATITGSSFTTCDVEVMGYRRIGTNL